MTEPRGLLALVLAASLSGCASQVPAPPGAQSRVINSWASRDEATGAPTTVELLGQAAQGGSPVVFVPRYQRRFDGTSRIQYANERCESYAAFSRDFGWHVEGLMREQGPGSDATALRKAFYVRLDQALAPCWVDVQAPARVWASHDAATGAPTTVELEFKPGQSTKEVVVIEAQFRRRFDGSSRVQEPKRDCPGLDGFGKLFGLHAVAVTNAQMRGRDASALQKDFNERLDQALAPCWTDETPR